jgi:NADH-quinone oxidoreductase subunit E
MKRVNIDQILDQHKQKHGNLISILQDIQDKYNYLPEDALRQVAEKTDCSLTDLYGVATFYKAFSLKPRGKHLISTCLGTACHVRGSVNILKRIQTELNIKPGETTPDKEFSLEAVNCLGACALGPVVVADGHYFSHVTPAKIPDILGRTQKGLDHIDIKTDERVFPVEVSCAHCNHSLMDDRQVIDAHPVIRVTISFNDKHGWLALSSLYGSYHVSSEHEIPEKTVVQMFCPHCHAELRGGVKCSDCGAPMVPMIVRGGGVIQICSRRGCKNHLLDFGETTVE